MHKIHTKYNEIKANHRSVEIIIISILGQNKFITIV